jgi:hypothetical protein
VVRIDHYALKFLLDQRLSIVPQHQWVTKLFGYDFAVEFRPGRLNTVADALSRRNDVEAGVHAVSGPAFDLFAALRRELQDDDNLRALQDTIVEQRGAPWRVVDGLILHGRRVFVPATSEVLATVLELAHTAGHEGF